MRTYKTFYNQFKSFCLFVIFMTVLGSCLEDKDEEDPLIESFSFSYNSSLNKYEYGLSASDNLSIKSVVVYLNSEIIYSYTAMSRDGLSRRFFYSSSINTMYSEFTLKAVVTDFADNTVEKTLEMKAQVSLSGNKTKVQTGSYDTIVWSGIEYQTINIELYQGGKFCRSIYSNLNASYQQYYWAIPADLSTASDYRLRISNSYNSSQYIESPLFTIESVASIYIFSPDSTSNWQGGTYKTIQWDSRGLSGDVKIDLYYKGEYNYTIAYSYPNNGACSWYVPATALSDNQFRIRISSVANELIYSESQLFRIVEPSVAYGTMTDIDGNVYRTVTIGNQTWMAENLRVTHFNDGKAMSYVTDNTNWTTTTYPAYCYQSTDTGALYNGYTVNDGRLAPTGWHIPTNDEWNTLIQYVGETDAGYALKSKNSYWLPSTGITNSTGFSAKVSGFRDWNGDYYSINAYYWTSTASSFSNYAYCRAFLSESNLVSLENRSYNTGCAVRCVRNNK